MLHMKQDDKLDSSVAGRLKYARMAQGYTTASAFARKMGLKVEQSYINQENGNRGLTLANAQKYAKALKINLSWLVDGTGPMLGPVIPEGPSELVEAQNFTVWAPEVGWVDAGRFSEGRIHGMAEDEHRKYHPCIHPRQSVFALRIKPDCTSMNRIAPPGSIIFVDYDDKELIDRKNYVFMLDGETTFKRYRLDNGRIWLEPDSTEQHDIIMPSSGLRVIGRVISVLREY